MTRSDFAQHYAFSEAGGSPRTGEFWDDDDDEDDTLMDNTALSDALLTPRTRRRVVEARKSILSAPVFQPSSPDTSTPNSLNASRNGS